MSGWVTCLGGGITTELEFNFESENLLVSGLSAALESASSGKGISIVPIANVFEELTGICKLSSVFLPDLRR